MCKGEPGRKNGAKTLATPSDNQPHITMAKPKEFASWTPEKQEEWRQKKRAQDRKYQAENAEKNAERNRKYYEANKEKKRKQD